MLDRRHVLAAAATAPFFLVSGCAEGHSRRPASATASDSRTVSTALGDVVLECAADVASWWTPCVQEGAERVSRLWGRSRRALRLTVARDDAEFAQSDATLDAVTAGVTTARGITLSPHLKASLTRAGCVGIVAHEMTHARLGHFGADRTVMWLKEGGAEYTAYRGSGVPLRQLWPALGARTNGSRVTLTGPPGEGDFAEDAATAYQWAAAYVTYVAEAEGWEAVRALMEERPDGAHAASWIDGKTRSATIDFGTWLTRAISTRTA